MIRKAVLSDIPQIMPLFDKAREYMRRNGNMSQWINGYPSEPTVRNDIENGNFYVFDSEGVLYGCFAFIIGEELTYAQIEGNWPDDSRYGTVHRLASDGTGKGLLRECVAFCLDKINTLRIDTHSDNSPMRSALEKEEFVYCGIIHVEDGSPRLAYQKSIKRL